MIDAILSRLERVKRTGRDSWIASCPAHEDHSPSMTLRALEDGRILCRCFAGCPFDSIAAAVGLDWDVWFPEKPIEHAKPLRRPFPAADVLKALSDEVLIVQVLGEDIAHGKAVATDDHARLLVAIERIRESRSAALGEC